MKRPSSALDWYRWMLGGVLAFLLILVFVGAIVRASGAGLGCPDWPTCWGCLVPPWKADQIDLEKIDFEKFKRKAERLGRNPDEVTRETVLASFNPVHTWTEFINRLVSLPIGLFSLASVVFALAMPPIRDRWRFRLVAIASLLIILINAWMGREIVYSGLKPGIITTHLALAMLLIVLLVYGRWIANARPAELNATKKLFYLVVALFGFVVAEGIMGAQVRELTDELAKSHIGEDRASWIGEIEKTGIFLVHRSFSWFIVILSIAAYIQARKQKIQDWRVGGTLGLVLTMMVMGVILGHVAILPVVQVLHVGVAALMVTVIFSWMLRLTPALKGRRDLLASVGEEA
ncbi:MAG: COX15/CtaA family protein [Verrucomicrobiales bacterium]|nr:COX15/CtaA family protein [Verrucomicrobiales bacterium]